ncbi:MAG: hypothetical protein FWF23_03800, partial [Alphaproteobacteria bacterium]|nr:hypothetical protein [Alphaproteobacteria bacterium]
SKNIFSSRSVMFSALLSAVFVAALSLGASAQYSYDDYSWKGPDEQEPGPDGKMATPKPGERTGYHDNQIGLPVNYTGTYYYDYSYMDNANMAEINDAWYNFLGNTGQKIPGWFANNYMMCKVAGKTASFLTMLKNVNDVASGAHAVFEISCPVSTASYTPPATSAPPTIIAPEYNRVTSGSGGGGGPCPFGGGGGGGPPCGTHDAISALNIDPSLLSDISCGFSKPGWTPQKAGAQHMAQAEANYNYHANNIYEAYAACNGDPACMVQYINNARERDNMTKPDSNAPIQKGGGSGGDSDSYFDRNNPWGKFFSCISGQIQGNYGGGGQTAGCKAVADEFFCADMSDWVLNIGPPNCRCKTTKDETNCDVPPKQEGPDCFFDSIETQRARMAWVRQYPNNLNSAEYGAYDERIWSDLENNRATSACGPSDYDLGTSFNMDKDYCAYYCQNRFEKTGRGKCAGEPTIDDRQYCPE